MTSIFFWARRGAIVLFLALLFGYSGVAWAHSEQTEAAQLQIAPRRDYLSLRIVGAGLDLRDAVARSEGASGHTSTESTASALLQRLAARYIESHVFFEQGEQVLPVKAGPVHFWKRSASDPDSEHFEIFARAERPAKLARTPLTVSVTLFGNLDKAATIVYLGGDSHVVRGVKDVEFPLASTIPTLRGDLTDFAWSGAQHPFSGVDHLLFLVVLFLAASVLPLRRLVVALVGFTLAHGIAFSLVLTGQVAFSAFLAALGAIISIVAVAALAWWQARQDERGISFAEGAPLLIVLATLGGLLHGFSGAVPLQAWGLPETSLFACILAWTMGVAASQVAMTAIVWPLLSHFHRKFAHNAQYGGMSWTRTLQIASLACMAIGGWWFAQSDVEGDLPSISAVKSQTTK
ncbi:hypothetical protein IAD21_02939 [Abditibacteriota bacterium]|nr:hypothetical protein IAD21_02939 [Abditibacteriota bacterium]